MFSPSGQSSNSTFRSFGHHFQKLAPGWFKSLGLPVGLVKFQTFCRWALPEIRAIFSAPCESSFIALKRQRSSCPLCASNNRPGFLLGLVEASAQILVAMSKFPLFFEIPYHFSGLYLQVYQRSCW